MTPSKAREITTEILHSIPLKKPCDCSCCYSLTKALLSGRLCEGKPCIICGKQIDVETDSGIVKDARKMCKPCFKIKLKEYRHTIEGRAFLTLQAIRRRCNAPQSHRYHRYGGRGIKCLITRQELERLVVRDDALSMKEPTIDRIDNNGNYEFKNCRFIERTENKKPSIS